MTGLLICVFLIMGSMAVWADQTGAVSGQTRVFDQAGLFSETEKIQLEADLASERKPAVYCFCTIWTDRASQEENVIFLLQGQ